MQTQLGRFSFQLEQPEPIKFAWPVLLFGELFTTPRHLAALLGYLATIGWETYLPDLRTAISRSSTPLAELGFDELAALARDTLAALGRDAIAVGHGLGGLLALELAGSPGVKAAVALAPLLPGYQSPLFMNAGGRFARWRKRALRPPRRRVLADLLQGADPNQFQALAAALVPDVARAPLEIASGEIRFAQGQPCAPRLIVGAENDRLVPIERLRTFAASLGAQFKIIEGCGHWLIGGRSLERAVAELQRFLVRSLGQDLLLLFPEEWRNDPERTE